MYSLRPHTKIDFVRLWKYGFRLSGVLIALALVGFVVSTVLTGAPLTLGTEFSGGTSIQINDAGDVTEDQLEDAFNKAANKLGYETQISSIQTAASMSGGNGYIVKTTDTVSTNASEIMSEVEGALDIDENAVEIETIGASWGASVIWSSVLAFFLSCLGILAVIAIRYREPRMGVVALICLFHDMIVVLGIYAWAGLFFHMEITSDVIAALLAIIGYSLYDTVVVFHRISRNASPQMKCSLLTCANTSLNEVIVRTINTSITSVIPVLFMLIIGTDTLVDFAFAMFCGMVVGVYSTLAISAPIYTKWKAKDPAYARLENKYPYEVVQSPFTKQMMLEARKETAEKLKVEKQEHKEAKAAEQRSSRRRRTPCSRPRRPKNMPTSASGTRQARSLTSSSRPKGRPSPRLTVRSPPTSLRGRIRTSTRTSNPQPWMKGTPRRRKTSSGTMMLQGPGFPAARTMATTPSPMGPKLSYGRQTTLRRPSPGTMGIRRRLPRRAASTRLPNPWIRVMTPSRPRRASRTST